MCCTIDSLIKHDKKSSLDVIKGGEYQINPLKFMKLIDILIDYSR